MVQLPDFDVAVRDVVYQRPDGEPLLARIYQPHGPGPFPVMLDVHGGAWTKNDRTGNESIDLLLASTGFVVAAIDFRMPPDHAYPTSIVDTNFAIRWLKAHAADFNGRAEQLGGLGTSSGGHMLMLTVMRPHDLRYAALPLPERPELDATLDWVMLCWPIVDPLARYQMARATEREDLLEAHHLYWQTEAAMIEGNPRLLLARGEQAYLPPALIIQGTADTNVTPDMASSFATAYRAAGGEVQLEEYVDEVHGFIRQDLNAPAAVAALHAMRQFAAWRSRQAGLVSTS